MFVLFEQLRFKNSLTYITSPACATLDFARRLPIGSKAFLGFHTPVGSAGKFVLVLPRRLVIHFLIPKMLTGKRNRRR
jgi:hypothetical protein